MYIEAKMKEQTRELSARYLGSPNRAFVMIEKGAPVAVEAAGVPVTLTNREGKGLTRKNKQGEEVLVTYSKLTRYTPEDMLNRLRELDRIAKEDQAKKQALEEAKKVEGSV
jgi:methylthioribose-1-phosphate isomerase